MQLARLHNQISNNALLKYLYSLRVFTVPVVAAVMSKLSVAIFKTMVMYHVTRYWSVIGPHCMVWQDTVYIHSLPDPSLFFYCGRDLA